MQSIDLIEVANSLPVAWKSTIAGRPAGANLKVLRMDACSYPDEVHDFDEALLVLEGCMHLCAGGNVVEVKAGQVFVVQAGIQHSVAAGSHGTLVIIDR